MKMPCLENLSITTRRKSKPSEIKKSESPDFSENCDVGQGTRDATVSYSDHGSDGIIYWICFVALRHMITDILDFSLQKFSL